MTAEQRGMELLTMPMKDLPDLASQFARFLCQKYGGCTEVFLTAYTVYAQLAESRTCTDDLYFPDSEALAWFADRLPKGPSAGPKLIDPTFSVVSMSLGGPNIPSPPEPATHPIVVDTGYKPGDPRVVRKDSTDFTPVAAPAPSERRQALARIAERTLNDAKVVDLRYAGSWLVEAVAFAQWFQENEIPDGDQLPDQAFFVRLGGIPWNAFPGDPPTDPRVVAFGQFTFVPPNRNNLNQWTACVSAGKGKGSVMICVLKTRRQAARLIEALGIARPVQPPTAKED